MNAFITENIVNDRIREIEADAKKNRYLKKVEPAKVELRMTAFIVKWIKSMQIIFYHRDSHSKYICSR